MPWSAWACSAEAVSRPPTSGPDWPSWWLVDTEAETVLVFRRSSPAATFFDVALEQRSGDALTSPLLPGLSLAMSELFAR
jgi:Uma2 family endonuclease